MENVNTLSKRRIKEGRIRKERERELVSRAMKWWSGGRSMPFLGLLACFGSDAPKFQCKLSLILVT